MGNNLYDSSKKEKIINDLKNKIKESIISNFDRKEIRNTNELKELKYNLLKSIDSILEKQNIENLLTNQKHSENSFNENMNRATTIKTPLCVKREVFLSKDIQEKNCEITIEFQKFALNNFICENETIENEELGHYLLDIANISRIAYNNSNIFLHLMYEEYQKSNKNDIKIISSVDEIKQNFSSWAKKNNKKIIEKANAFIGNLEKIKIPYISEQKKESIKNYFFKLYKQLLILYYQCELSFTPIEINFKEEENFNSEKMIDIFNHGKKKVNFVYFPSLISNGSYLKNGKQWVFTYSKKHQNETFFFDKIKLEELILDKKKFCIPKLDSIVKLTVKHEIIPIITPEISEKIKKEYKYYIKNNKDGKIKEVKSDSSYEIGEDEELFNYDFYLMNDYVLSLFPKENDN